MTINSELRAEILRLYHAEKWRLNTIARQLRVHYSTVRRVIEQEGQVLPRAKCARKVDPYLPFIEETLRLYPGLRASRLHAMVTERGYTGKAPQFRSIIAKLRGSRHAEPYQRLRTLPGEQAQVDWGHFGRIEIGRASRPLMAFVMVLSYSRAIYLRFFVSQSTSNFLHGHEMAFLWFGGISRDCLYDNLKSVVLERTGKAIRFNSQFMDFAAHYRFHPQPVGVRRGNEKGRVERAIGYIRTNFFPARSFQDLADLNRQALLWCEGAALARCWPEDSRRTVGEVLLEERQHLLPLPQNGYPCHERCEVIIAKAPYARFDLNDYSVPPSMVQKTLVVAATTETVRILDGNTVVATHARCYDRGRTIEDKAHTEELSALKAVAGQHRRTNLLSEAVPSTAQLLTRAAERGEPLGRTTRQLQELLHAYGAAALESAIREALDNDLPNPHAVRLVLERHRSEAGKTAALPVSLPDDPRVRDLVLRPRGLGGYGKLQEED